MVDLDQRYLIIIIIVIIEIDMPNILVTLLIIYLQPQHLPPLLRLRLLALLLDRQRPDHPSRVAYDDGPGRYRFRNYTACSYKCKCSTRQG
jgi:hypothetical protein